MKERKRILEECLKILTSKGHYASILSTMETSFSVDKDSTSLDAEDGRDEGIRLRIFSGKGFLEHGETGCNRRSLLKKARELVRQAGKPGRLSSPEKPIHKNFVSCGKDPREVSVETKMDFCNALYGRFKHKEFVNLRVRYSESVRSSIFIDPQKSLSQHIVRVNVVVMPFVQSKGGEMRYHYKAFFAPGYEATDISDAALRKVRKMAQKVATAKKIRPGRYICYLSPEVTGLLAHESFGHGMEADTMLAGRARASEYLGKQIAPAEVSIIDNPAYRTAHGTYFFDDEGTITGPTYLVKKGIVMSPITDRYSAMRLQAERTGNARAESYDHKIYARMSNTYFDKGSKSPRSMLKDIKDGMYLHNSSGGMEDPKGWGVQIQGIVAERIIDGKRTGELFYEVGMTGFLPDLLGNIKAVGKDLSVPGTGFCGKGHKEWVKVAEGGPSLVIQGVHLS